MTRKDTRLQLLLAAERLFAERGVEGVSLREVNLAAGQRNTSAAHYHFGSKEALVAAVVEYRRKPVDQRRDELLDALQVAGKATDPRALVEAFITPLAEQVRANGQPEENHYLMFLAHLFLQSPDGVSANLRRQQAAEQRWVGMMVAALPDIPSMLLRARMFLMGRHTVVSLSVYQRRGLGLDVDFDLYLSELADCVTGYLVTPVSAATRLQLERQQQARESEPLAS